MLRSINQLTEVCISVPSKELNILCDKIKNSGLEEAEKLVSKLKETKDKCTISVDDVRWIKDNLDLGVPLHEWLTKCEIKLPEPPVIPRNPELEARIQRLKLEQQERDYQNMTKNVDASRVKYPDDTIGSQVKEMNRQLIAVAQFIVSVGAGFAFGFIGVELIVGDLDFGFRLLLGVICALIIALAEIYFLAKQLAQEDVPLSVHPLKLHQE